MKKIMILVVMMTLVMTTSVFAGEETFELKVDGKVDTIKVFVDETGLYLPVKETEEKLDEKIACSTYETIENSDVEYAPLSYFDENLEGLLMTSIDKKSVAYSSASFLEEKNNERIQSFKTKHVDLYNAMQKTVEQSYEFDVKVSAAANVEYAQAEMAEMVGVDKFFAKGDVKGYVNFADKEFKMNMDMAFDASPVMNETIKGIELLLKDNVLYYFDPSTESWTSEESLDNNDFSSSEVLDEVALGFMSSFADRMVKTESEDSTVYSLVLDEEALKGLINDYAGGVLYEDILDEAASEDVVLKIPKVEIEYVIKDGVLSAQYAEVALVVITTDVTINAFLSIDGDYINYGQEKEIQLPKLEENVLVESAE